jgi:hypothetical protein
MGNLKMASVLKFWIHFIDITTINEGKIAIISS